jgi:5-methylcytosine-specific restriction endonuclease McrA
MEGYNQAYYQKNKEKMDSMNKRYRARHRSHLNRIARGLIEIRKYKYSIQLKEERGSKCAICGYNKNYSALVWHHINPQTKELEMVDIHVINSQEKLNKAKEEANKCVLLCQNCHMELHYPHLRIKEIKT